MIKPPTRAEFKKVQQQVKDALKLASTHDPDLVKWLKGLQKEIGLLGKAVHHLVNSQELVLKAHVDQKERIDGVENSLKTHTEFGGHRS